MNEVIVIGQVNVRQLAIVDIAKERGLTIHYVSENFPFGIVPIEIKAQPMFEDYYPLKDLKESNKPNKTEIKYPCTINCRFLDYKK